MKEYNIFDLMKIILCLMIVAIHTKLLPFILYPWIRLAVPLFFVISSYLLSIKIISSPKQQKNEIIKHYIIRLIKLYLFWLVALLPITTYVRRSWFDDGILVGITHLIINPFLGQTFIASWYIAALIIGTIIVSKLFEKYNYKILIMFFVVIYLFCCLASGYSFLLDDNSLLKHILTNTYFEVYCSFAVSLVYILYGKILANYKFKIDKKKNMFLMIVSCILLYFEWIIIYKTAGFYNKDCYIFLLPTSMLIFNYVKDISIKINNAKKLRQLSNFVYPLHGSIAVCLNVIIKNFVSTELFCGVINFIITIVVCIICFLIVKKLESKFKILKYSY